MAKQPEGMKPMKAVVVSVASECDAGHKAGDTFEIGCWDTGGLCGFFYHDIFPYLNVMQFGGRYPWNPGDEMTLTCPDEGKVTIKIKMEK
jgi:uncharacterized repeat protein (TIGR04076 family)